MYRNFTLTESEKKKILNMHKESGYKTTLNEDVDATDGGVGHMGIAYLYNQLKSFGFNLDEKQLFGGTPTVYKGNDDNGVFIQFYKDNGFYFQLAVTKNGKQLLLKKYQLKESQNYVSDYAVKQILHDVENYKNMDVK
jgi:hypothetical protein